MQVPRRERGSLVKRELPTTRGYERKREQKKVRETDSPALGDKAREQARGRWAPGPSHLTKPHL